MVDKMIEWLQSWDRSIAPHYKQHYVSLSRAGRTDNFVKFRPMKHYLRVEPILDCSPRFEKKLRQAGLDVVDYWREEPRYRIMLTASDFPKLKPILKELLRMAYARATIVSWGKH